MSERIGILGLARSGRAAALLALAQGRTVFASDAGDTPGLRAAAEQVRAAGGEAEVGGHTVERLAECDVLVVSPGIAPTAAVLRDERLVHLPRVSELEYAFRSLDAPVIAVTGTNGKSTTTALTAHLLRTAALDAPAAGNIGLPLSEVALREQRPDWVVVEASSFQLADTDRFAPRIGVVTNLSPDHLDRYASVDAYYADKAKLFGNATPSSTWVLNAEDPDVLRLPGEAPGARRYFRTEGTLDSGQQGAFVVDGTIVVRTEAGDQPLLEVGALRIPGRHNQSNALAAALAALAAGTRLPAVAEGLRSFGGLEHRLERVAEIGGVLWINDSKATNIASTLVALESVDRPVVLLLGGRHKGEPYTRLLPVLRGRTRAIIAYGEAGGQVAADLGAELPVEGVAGRFEDVVERAAAVAHPGDVVLLSPACASFDMFTDYEERGRRFRDLVLVRMEAE